MPRIFLDLKSGGDNSYAVPPTLKSGGASPRPPPIDARDHNAQMGQSNWCVKVIVSTGKWQWRFTYEIFKLNLTMDFI